MKVKEVHTRRGNHPLVVIDVLPYEARLGSLLSDGERTWRITGAEGTGPPLGLYRSRGGECCLILKDVDGSDILPEVGAELTLKPKPLGKMTVGELTVDQAIELLAAQSKERQELASHLRDLDSAIMHLEMKIGSSSSMKAFKMMRETFNKIPPKWFHR